MSREIQVKFQTGKTVYTTIRNQTSGALWNLSGGTGGAFENFVSGNWLGYSISLTEQGVSAVYMGNFPTAIGAGVYSLDAREQVGANPVQTDATVAVGDIHWNGTVNIPMSDLATSGQLGQIAPIRIFRGQQVLNFPFKMVSSTDHITPFTSGVVSGQISRDGGAFGVLQSGAFTEMGLGFYRTTLTSGDLLATTVALSFSANGISGGTADARDMTLILQRTSGQ